MSLVLKIFDNSYMMNFLQNLKYSVNRIPFFVKHTGNRKPNAELREAMEDIRLKRNLNGPYAAANEAVRSMLDD